MRYYMHSVPGRLRIKIPEIKGHTEKARSIQLILKEIEGVESIRANTITGSIVIKYDGDRLPSERILTILTEQGHFDEAQTFSMDHALFESGSKAGQALSKAFCGWAVGRALEGTSLSFLAAFI